jgi:Cu+-exporting ATPase
MNTDTLIATECFHCGEPCDEGAVCLEDKSFCCEGCKLVYTILDDNELNTYYCLEDQPGTSFKKHSGSGRFEYLDDESVVERLTDFRSNGFVSASFYIPNIHCTSCVWLLEKLYKLDHGITKSSVNFLKRELTISFKKTETSLRSVVELLSSIGYEPELRLEKLDQKKGTSPNRKLWLKLGVAGFSFGNIMLFSFPEYLSGSTLSSDGSFHIFFGILNIALALPVLLYSASDYLKSAWAAIKQGGINLDVPISIGILSLFGRSLYEILSGVGAGYMDSFTGLVFFLLIGRFVQKKTYERLSFDRDYKSYLPISVTVLDRNEHESSVPIDKLAEGSRMRIRNQELVPADAVLQSENCFIDYSFITGESEPVEAQQGDTIYAGGKVIGQAAEMTTVKEVSNSYLTKLWNNAAFSETEQARVTSLADRISPHFTLAIIGIAVTAGIMWWSVSTTSAISVFTAVLIIACPCALALSTPFTLGSALNIFAQNGFYVKGIDVIEQLANSSMLVFDKTGTLTKSDESEITFHGQPLTDTEQGLVASACKQSIHPLSQKIAGQLQNGSNYPIDLFEDVINSGIKARISDHELIIGSARLLNEHLPSATIDTGNKKPTSSVVHIAIDGKWKGWFEISSAYRPGITSLLSNIKERFSMFLLSGDNSSQQEQFSPYFEEGTLRFEQTPQQKLDFIKKLQSNGLQVVMVGDGLNDAGALQKSDFGIALTDDVSSFTPACDAILDGQSLQQLNKLINFAQSSITIIKLSFVLSLMYNVIGLGFAVAGQLSPLVAAILMPLSSISIMLFTTGSAYLTAKRKGLATWK